MRTIVLVLLSALLLFVPAHAGNFNFLFGSRQLDESTWRPVDGQVFLGFELDTAPRKWPVRLTFGLHFSNQENLDERENLKEAMTMVEFSVGVRKLWRATPRMRPWIGGGASIVLLTHFEIDPITPETVINDGPTLGGYLAAGILWRMGKDDARFNVGIDVRLMRGAEASFTQRSGSLDYEQIAFAVGFNWGRDRDRKPRGP
jgi:hypothetical protein